MFFEGIDTTKILVGDFEQLIEAFNRSENILLVTSPSFTQRGQVDKCVSRLTRCTVIVYDNVLPNPDCSDLKHAVEQFSEYHFDRIIALGGGSVLDSAKVLSLWLNKKNLSFEQLCEVAVTPDALIPLIAIPTSSGTGSEVTPFATIWDAHKQKKYSINGLIPNRVILDASLTLSLPKQETLYSAMDALSHSLESIWNRSRTKQSQAHAEAAINLICDNLPAVLANPLDFDARQNLQFAACLAGLAIATTKTAIAHAMSYQLTLRHKIPHGLACSVTLASILNNFDLTQLNLSKDLADKISALLTILDLKREVERFVEWNELLQQFDTDLDPSRSKNFVFAVDGWQLSKIIEDASA